MAALGDYVLIKFVSYSFRSKNSERLKKRTVQTPLPLITKASFDKLLRNRTKVILAQNLHFIISFYIASKTIHRTFWIYSLFLRPPLARKKKEDKRKAAIKFVIFTPDLPED